MLIISCVFVFMELGMFRCFRNGFRLQILRFYRRHRHSATLFSCLASFLYLIRCQIFFTRVQFVPLRNREAIGIFARTNQFMSFDLFKSIIMQSIVSTLLEQRGCFWIFLFAFANVGQQAVLVWDDVGGIEGTNEMAYLSLLFDLEAYVVGVFDQTWFFGFGQRWFEFGCFLLFLFGLTVIALRRSIASQIILSHIGFPFFHILFFSQKVRQFRISRRKRSLRMYAIAIRSWLMTARLLVGIIPTAVTLLRLFVIARIDVIIFLVLSRKVFRSFSVWKWLSVWLMRLIVEVIVLRVLLLLLIVLLLIVVAYGVVVVVTLMAIVVVIGPFIRPIVIVVKGTCSLIIQSMPLIAPLLTVRTSIASTAAPSRRTLHQIGQNIRKNSSIDILGFNCLLKTAFCLICLFDKCI